MEDRAMYLEMVEDFDITAQNLIHENVSQDNMAQSKRSQIISDYMNLRYKSIFQILHKAALIIVHKAGLDKI